MPIAASLPAECDHTDPRGKVPRSERLYGGSGPLHRLWDMRKSMCRRRRAAGLRRGMMEKQIVIVEVFDFPAETACWGGG